MTTIPHSAPRFSQQLLQQNDRTAAATPPCHEHDDVLHERVLRTSSASSENNKRVVSPPRIRHFGFPLMVGECMMGRASPPPLLLLGEEPLQLFKHLKM